MAKTPQPSLENGTNIRSVLNSYTVSRSWKIQETILSTDFGWFLPDEGKPSFLYTRGRPARRVSPDWERLDEDSEKRRLA